MRVELPGRVIAGASLVAYLIPLAALLLGVLVGSLFSELAAIVAGLCCCAAAYLLLRVLDRRFARMQALQPRMISITTNEEDEEHGQGTDGGEF